MQWFNDINGAAPWIKIKHRIGENPVIISRNFFAFAQLFNNFYSLSKDSLNFLNNKDSWLLVRTKDKLDCLLKEFLNFYNKNKTGYNYEISFYRLVFKFYKAFHNKVIAKLSDTLIEKHFKEHIQYDAILNQYWEFKRSNKTYTFFGLFTIWEGDPKIQRAMFCAAAAILANSVKKKDCRQFLENYTNSTYKAHCELAKELILLIDANAKRINPTALLTPITFLEREIDQKKSVKAKDKSIQLTTLKKAWDKAIAHSDFASFVTRQKMMEQKEFKALLKVSSKDTTKANAQTSTAESKTFAQPKARR